jgi:signal transduction histidine kinase/GAF domain-containing protein
MVIAELQRSVAERKPANRPALFLIVGNDFKTCTETELFGQLQKQFGVTTSISNEDAPFSGCLVELFRQALDKQNGQIWIFVHNILGFPSVIARDLLVAFQCCKELPAFQRRFSVLVTGSEDFVHLTYGPNSPYRYARKFLVTGLDEKVAATFYTRLRNRQRGIGANDRGIAPVTGEDITREISLDAFDYLYEQTGGDPHLIEEIVVNAARHPHILRSIQLASKWEIAHARDCIDAFVNTQMPFDYVSQITLRETERSVETFDGLLAILQGSSPPLTPPEGEPGFLEVSGLIRRTEPGEMTIACPIWKRFLVDSLNPLYSADVYALQLRWKEAWATYESLKEDERDRPVSGLAAFRFRLVLKRWEESVGDWIVDGPDAVCRHFFLGAKHLLGFDNGAIYDEQTHVLLNANANCLKPPRDTAAYEISHYPLTMTTDRRDYRLDLLRVKLWSNSGRVLSWPPTTQPVLVLERHHYAKAIDTSDQEWLARSIDRFWQAYLSACEIEYNRLIGSIREKHLRVIEKLNDILSESGSDMGLVVQGAAEKLVTTAGYSRIQIALVDAKHERIQAVAAHSGHGVPCLNFRTDYGLKADDLKPNVDDWDIQQWVVLKKEMVVISDASSAKQKSPSTNWPRCLELGMKAITVVPIMVEDEVLGTIQFERADNNTPSAAECALFKILAGQVGVIFRQAQHLTMLQNALSELDSRVTLINSKGEVVFLNQAAVREDYPQKQAGWQIEPIRYHGFPRLGDTSADSSGAEGRRLLSEVERKGRRVRSYFFPTEASERGRASDWLLVPIDDFRKQLPEPFGGIRPRSGIGFVEKVSDLTDLFRILQALKSWLAAADVKATSAAILSFFRAEQFSWCRIYLLKQDEKGRRFLQSLNEYGLNEIKNILSFRNGLLKFYEHDPDNLQSWHVFGVGTESIYTYDPARGDPTKKSVEKCTYVMGLPAYNCNFRDHRDIEYLEKEDKAWIDAPLLVGERIIGKISISMPAEGKLSPEWWQIFRYASLGAAAALDSAIRAEHEGDRKVQEAWKEASEMAVHQLSNKLSPCESLLHYAQNEADNRPELSKTYVATAISVLRQARSIVSDFRRYADEKPWADNRLMEVSMLIAIMEHDIQQTYPGIAVETKIEDNIGIKKIRMSATAFSEVVDVLVNNSVMHGGLELKDLHITLCARSSFAPANPPTELVAGDLLIIYADNGKGVSPQARSILFHPFKTTHPKGTGLGLSIVKRILKQFGGSISADENTGDEGAIFRIAFPDTPLNL